MLQKIILSVLGSVPLKVLMGQPEVNSLESVSEFYNIWQHLLPWIVHLGHLKLGFGST